MLPTYLWTRTSFRLRHLREINLVDTLPVAQPILVSICSIWLPYSIVQALENTVKVHFHIDRDPAIQHGLGHVNVQVLDLDFDDFGDDAVVLVSCHPNRRHSTP